MTSYTYSTPLEHEPIRVCSLSQKHARALAENQNFFPTDGPGGRFLTVIQKSRNRVNACLQTNANVPPVILPSSQKISTRSAEKTAVPVDLFYTCLNTTRMSREITRPPVQYPVGMSTLPVHLETKKTGCQHQQPASVPFRRAIHGYGRDTSNAVGDMVPKALDEMAPKLS